MEDYDYIEVKKPPDFIAKTSAYLFIIYGVLAMIIFAFTTNFSQIWYLNAGFVIFGLAFYNFTTDLQKTILGIIGMFTTFYTATIWSQYIVSIFTNIMIVYSVGLLALSFAIVCQVTCTWPDLEYDQ
jgi:hypothetical protein